MNKLYFMILLAVWYGLDYHQAAAQTGESGLSIAVETVESERIRGERVYAAKFICGRWVENAQFSRPVVPAFYRSAINVYNPNSGRVRFTKRAVVTQSQREERGEVGETVTETLEANQGLEVDCRDIAVLLNRDADFFDLFVDTPVFGKGFVVITTERQLVIKGVYTALVVSGN